MLIVLLYAAVLKNPETNPYPHKFHVTYDDAKFHEEFKDLKPGETANDKEIKIAGRIYTVRTLSSKLIFYGGCSVLSSWGPAFVNKGVWVNGSGADRSGNRHSHVSRHGEHRLEHPGCLPGPIGQGRGCAV